MEDCTKSRGWRTVQKVGHQVVGPPGSDDFSDLSRRSALRFAYGQGAARIWQALHYKGSEGLMSGQLLAAYGQGVSSNNLVLLYIKSQCPNIPTSHPT
jgi:hypothetical protein